MSWWINNNACSIYCWAHTCFFSTSWNLLFSETICVLHSFSALSRLSLPLSIHIYFFPLFTLSNRLRRKYEHFRLFYIYTNLGSSPIHFRHKFDGALRVCMCDQRWACTAFVRIFVFLLSLSTRAHEWQYFLFIAWLTEYFFSSKDYYYS